MRRTKRKSQVEWKDGAENTIRALRPHPYIAERVLTAEEAAKYEGHLYPGAPFVTSSYLEPRSGTR